MSSPFMQLYVADYLGDTRHLTTEQHGAYLLLLMTMWRSDGVLPADDAKLARITGCTPARWAKIKDDVLEFFVPCEGGMTNPRLKMELEKAREKSIKRADAGARGGRAKALKDKKVAVANATRLPCHSSEPEPENTPPTPQEGGEPINLKPFAKLLCIVATSGMTFDQAVQAAWEAQPIVDGKRRSTRPDVQRAFGGVLRRGSMPGEALAGLRAYYALPASTKDGGRFAHGAAVILNRDRWREFVGGPAQAASVAVAPTFDGPPALRDAVVRLKGEDFARAWIDSCRWRGADRTLLARNSFAAAKLASEIGDWLGRARVRVEAGERPREAA